MTGIAFQVGEVHPDAEHQAWHMVSTEFSRRHPASGWQIGTGNCNPAQAIVETLSKMLLCSLPQFGHD